MDATLSAPIGQLLDGRYLVESQIARGGMATVYLARDVRLERTIALKVAHPELARDREFVDRFIGEARAVARLSSPNVVAVFDQGSTGDLHYIAMEYVPGPTLRELLVARGRLSPREALDIIERVLTGLAAAHDAGIIHRDVKPENVLLGNGTAVKVADFGLARAESGIRHTRSGLLIGTAAYLAPEQVISNAADQRTDVYAAGVMLFELLTGQQPHTGDTPLAVAYRHVNVVVPAPSSVNPELPPALDALVALATSRDPELRPADARHYLHAIKEVRRGMPLPPVTRRDVPVAGPVSQPGADGTAANGIGAAARPAGLALSDGGAGPGGGPAGAGAVAVRPTYDVISAQYAGGPPPGNRTMVVPVGEEPDIGDGYRRGRRYRGDRPYREPRLQRWLFSHRILIVLAVVLAMLVAGWLSWWLAAGQYTSVPSVAGMTVSTARGDLTNAGLHAVTGHGRNSYSVQAGQVISTDPAAGGRIMRGGTVVIVGSLGPVMVTMPSVTGEPLAQAEQTVKADGLTFAQPRSETSASIPAGVVISTNPVAYQHWPKNKPVDLVVSSGQPLPNFVGQQISTAQAFAAAGGYSINPVADDSSTQPAGTVTGQSPGQGTPVTPSEVVTLQVSTGGQNGQGEVAIPDVRGMTASEAAGVLQSSGFSVQVSQGLFGQKVTSYSPTGQAPPGTTITITVGHL
ncbi:MAG: protein kinase domain-containing protein [Streptosporangiaceae bacterium]